MRRPVGKLTIEELKRHVLPFKGAPDARVILGQMVGGDAAAVDLDDQRLLLKADPITGAVEELGWLAVHVPSNDVATVGGRPQWLLPILIMPTSETAERVEAIMRQIDEAAKELDIAIVGGHTEFISGIDHPIVCSFLAATTRGRVISAAGAEPGNSIVLTKGAAIEATGILASDLRREVESAFGEEFVRRARAFIRDVSVVREALEAVSIDGVKAIHDPTEGGLYTALHEVAEASGVGLLVHKRKIFMAEETRKICLHFGIDPLGAISSGSLLIAVEPSSLNTLLEKLEDLGVEAKVIGEVREKSFGRKMVDDEGRISELPLPPRDELWKLYERITQRD